MKKLMFTVAVSAALLISVSTAQADDAGKKTYQTACMACHGAGIAGAPKFGDKAAWKDRVTQDIATLQDHALKGFKGKTGMMPPKGGRMDLSDADVNAAVVYMVNNAK